MELYLFHSVNSGLFLWDGENGLLVDGIHMGREQGFSIMPILLAKQMEQKAGLFAYADGLLFTHLHPDHFDEKRVRKFSTAASPLVYGPGLLLNNAAVRPIRPGLALIRMRGIKIMSKVTVHDGDIFRSDAHRSYLIHMRGESVFVAGDAALRESDAVEMKDFFGPAPAAAFLNPYQLASLDGQAFLRILKPERLFLYHMPFRKDDAYHCYGLAKQALRSMPRDFLKAETIPHMAWLDGKQPCWEDTWKGEERHAVSGIAKY